jgi:hypothetical protein
MRCRTGGLVKTLLPHSFRLFSVHAKQLNLFRDRHTSAGGRMIAEMRFVLLAASLLTRHG